MLNVGKSNNNPKHIIISPLTIPSVEEFLVKKDPTEDAMAARDIKTIEKSLGVEKKIVYESEKQVMKKLRIND